jgi:TetR/AcrR family transcriptional regulator, mexJK operon transcriptional repressor
VLDAATDLFLRDGYGTTSLEAVAAAAGVSKRTLYARFSGKAALLQMVVARLVTNWLPAFDAEIGQGSGLRDTLLGSARVMLATALTPQALGLYRLIIAEIGRFPELALVMRDAGAAAGTDRLANVMATAGIIDPIWAAEQFMALVLSVPQRRGLGLGPPLDTTGQEAWAKRAVDLFLDGLSVSDGAGGRGCLKG